MINIKKVKINKRTITLYSKTSNPNIPNNHSDRPIRHIPRNVGIPFTPTHYGNCFDETRNKKEVVKMLLENDIRIYKNLNLNQSIDFNYNQNINNILNENGNEIKNNKDEETIKNVLTFSNDLTRKKFNKIINSKMDSI